MKMPAEIKLLLTFIDEGYEDKAWHGPNLRGAIRGLSIDELARRPGKGRHNIWEIVVHCAYWKYIVRRRILGEKRGSFPLDGSNWFTRSKQMDAVVWRKDLALLENMHRWMRETVAQCTVLDLSRIPRGSNVRNRAIISGIAMHDVYHAGQIQLIKRMVR